MIRWPSKLECSIWPQGGRKQQNPKSKNRKQSQGHDLSVCSGPGVDDIVFQSSCTETTGGAAEGRWLDRLRPSPHGRQESGGDGGGRDEKRSSFRSPGPPTASTHQVRTRNRNVRNSHLFKKMFLLKTVCVCVFAETRGIVVKQWSWSLSGLCCRSVWLVIWLMSLLLGVSWYQLMSHGIA